MTQGSSNILKIRDEHKPLEFSAEGGSLKFR